ncbi:MAG: exonuclease [Symploca sp. SIO2B6]|nr:exonuclease [Symploca sp. SIO2B6]
MLLATKNFLVIDTEGQDILREIAIIDEWGSLVYEAYNSGHLDHQTTRLHCYPLAKIISDVSVRVAGKTLVFHNATHDLHVLQQNFADTHKQWINCESICTLKLSQRYFPKLNGYGLDELSRNLNLRVSGQYFNRNLAHVARYDAAFTYELYRTILSHRLPQPSHQNVMTSANPFSSSRVDTPFQSHPDLKNIYGTEYQALKSALLDIQADPNHQSGGAVVIGEPGSGKTHLMMRLAQEVLITHRLLFIRQPNNADTILFHIYSRILESLVEPVPGSQYNQLESLIAHSIINFLKEEFSGHSILEKCASQPTFLFKYMGRAGSDVRRKNWDRLIKLLQPWWTQKYSAAGGSWQILRGMLQYCRYSDESRKSIIVRWLAAQHLDPDVLANVHLEDWEENLSREAFSLEAIAVLSKLSLLDEPLILVFDQLEGLGRPQNRIILENFGEAIKEIFTHVPNSLLIFNLFPDRWQQMQSEIFDGSIIDRMSQYVVHLQRPNEQDLKTILQAKLDPSKHRLDLLFNDQELKDILGQASIRSVINRAAAYYRYKESGIPLPDRSTPKVNFNGNLSSDSEIMDRRLDTIEKTLNDLNQRIAGLEAKAPIDIQVSRDAHSEHLFQREEPVEMIDPDFDLLLDYLRQEQEKLEQAYEKPTIIDDNDDIGKLMAIASELHSLYRFDVQELKLGKKRVLPEHLLFQKAQAGNVVGFLHIGGGAFTSRLKNFNKLVISNKHLQFTLIRDIREETIKGKVGKAEIEKLRYCPNGEFVLLNREDRIQFDLLYNLVLAIQNKDLELTVEKAIQLYRKHQPQYWLLETLVLNS